MLDKPIFDERLHTYTNQKYGYSYTPVSTLVGKYKEPFDTVYWSLYNAGRRILGITDDNKSDYSKIMMKHGLNFSNKTLENLQSSLKLVLKDDFRFLLDTQNTEQKNWKEKTLASTTAGTREHKRREEVLVNTGLDISIHGLNIPVRKIVDEIEDLFSLEDGTYPELMIWHNGYKISGISDKVTIETIGAIRFIDIDDYKTNEKIDTQSYCNKTTGEFKKMLYPVNNLMCCNYIHYSLQLSIYAYLLECFGFVVRNIKFTHLPFNEDKTMTIGEQPYFVNYLKDSVIKMLNHYNTK